jgi:hypothetical protein
MQNKKSSSAERKGLLNTRTDALLLGGGLLFLLVNVVVIFGIDTSPRAWLFYANMRYWSVCFSAVLWITALWIASESIDSAEDYLPLIRTFAGTGILLVIIFALRSSMGAASPVATQYLHWLDLFLVVAVCNLFRSLFLLYDYFYEKNDGGWEEAQWCWGTSGFIVIALAVFGCMCMISIKTQINPQAHVITESLFVAFRYGLQDMIQTGNASMGLRMFVLLLVIAAIAFVYVTGRWLLIVYLKLRGK